jgi:hypothetical protein
MIFPNWEIKYLNAFKDELRSQIGKINLSIMNTVDNRWKAIQIMIKLVSNRY